MSFKSLINIAVLVLIWHILSIFLSGNSFSVIGSHQSWTWFDRPSARIFAAVVQVGMLQHRYSVGRGAIARYVFSCKLKIHENPEDYREHGTTTRRPLASTYSVVWFVFFSDVHHISGCWLWHSRGPEKRAEVACFFQFLFLHRLLVWASAIHLQQKVR